MVFLKGVCVRVKKEKMKMIRVKHVGSLTSPRTNEEFWVKETNPKFDWYRKSRCWKVIKEKEVSNE